MLAGCHVIKRPSKKDGFCFKIIHPDGKSIYDTRNMVDSLPISANYAILRDVDVCVGHDRSEYYMHGGVARNLCSVVVLLKCAPA
jgi:hypothetical protein